MKVIFYFFLVGAILGLFFWYEVSIWSECLNKNSLWFCMRVLG